MRKTFLQNIIFLVLINLIIKPFWILGIDRTVQNTVGHEAYGKYQAIFNITIIFQIILDFGLQQYNSRVVSRSPEAMRGLFPNILMAKAFFALIYIAVTIAMGSIWGYQSQGFLLLMLLVGMQIALSFLLFFRSNISGLQWFKTDSVFSILDRMIAIPVMTVLLFTYFFKDNFKIEWYAGVQLLAYSLSAVIALIVCSRLQKIYWHHLNLKKILIVVKQSLPFAILVFLMSFYTRIDTVLLEKISSDTEIAGKYAAAFRLLDVANNMSGVLIAGLLLPLFAKMIKAKEDFGTIAELSAKILMAFSIFLAVLSTIWGQEILQLLYKNMDVGDSDILMWLMWCFPFYSFNYIYATLLTANGNIKVLIYISILGLFVNLVLNLSMLDANNSLNAVITAHNAFVTLIIVSIGNFWASKKLLNVYLTPKVFARLLFFFILLFAFAWAFKKYFNNVELLPTLVLVALAALSFFLVTGLIQLQEIKQHYRKLIKRN